MGRCKDILNVISRRKLWDVRNLYQSELTRNLNLLDIIGIGIGSSVGLAIFATSAHVAKHEAGPAVVLSVLVAGLGVLLSGLCHMELTTRFPSSGTGYTFCYATLGELLAFVVGWTVVLEHVIHGALASKAAWKYMEYMYTCVGDSNVTSTASGAVGHVFGFSNVTSTASGAVGHVFGFSNVTSTASGAVGHVFEISPDIFPCCVVICVTFMTLMTVKVFAIANFFLMSLSGLVAVAFICVGFFHVDSENWTSSPGFFSQGWSGIISGAAIFMSTFAGIDNLASCGEESRTPMTSLPTAFTIVTSTTFTLIFLSTLALTLATPWQQLSDIAALASAYENTGIFAGSYIIGFGAIFGLIPVLMGSFLKPERLLYSMSIDKLLPKCFSKLAFNGVPVYSHLVTGITIALCALLMEFSPLLEMTSIASILQCLSSAIILLYIRYLPVQTGICTEYTEFDRPQIFKDSTVSKQSSKNHQNEEKFVIFTKNNNELQRMDEPICAPKCTSSNFSKIVYTPSTKTNYVEIANPKYTSANYFSFQHSRPSSLGSLNRIQHSKPVSLLHSCPEAYTFKDEYNGSNKEDCYECRLNNTCDACENLTCAHMNNRKRGQDTVVTLARKTSLFPFKISERLFTFFASRKNPSDHGSWKLVHYYLLIYILGSTCFTVTCQVLYIQSDGAWWTVMLMCVSLALMIASSLLILCQSQNNAIPYFQTPCVPLMPLFSMTLNMFLLASLPTISWIRFAAWLLPGLLIYVCYSSRHSNNQELDDQEGVLFDISNLPSTNST